MNYEFEVNSSGYRRECEWCGKEINGGLDCLLLVEDGEDYYFCDEACAKGFSDGSL